MTDSQTIRADFPLLGTQIQGKPLVYFDNGATSQKPKMVIDAIEDYYLRYNANIHRGVHSLSQWATEAFEMARSKVQQHLNALQPQDVIFTSGTTHAINIVAFGLEPNIQANDRILVSGMEHHSNIVPWQMLCERTGAQLDVIPVLDDGTLDLAAYEALLSPQTRLAAFTHISNVLGTINPVEKMVAMARSKGIWTLVDGAQAVPHLRPNVAEIGCDYYVFSGHKMCAPTGIGVLCGTSEALDMLRPFQGGGEMIAQVSFEKTAYACLPHRLEAGTPNIEGAIALGVAVDYLNALGWDWIAKTETELLQYATQALRQIQGLRIIGEAPHKSAVISFEIAGVHPYDLGVLLDKMGIAIRTGHHCAQPLMDRFGVPGTARVSLAFYNTFDEIDYLITCLERAITMLR